VDAVLDTILCLWHFSATSIAALALYNAIPRHQNVTAITPSLVRCTLCEQIRCENAKIEKQPPRHTAHSSLPCRSRSADKHPLLLRLRCANLRELRAQCLLDRFVGHLWESKHRVSASVLILNAIAEKVKSAYLAFKPLQSSTFRSGLPTTASLNSSRSSLLSAFA